MKSYFLALVGTSLIILSFSLTALIYQGVFRVTYLSTLHTMVTFIVLGFTTDNIFVLFDAWQQSDTITLFRGSSYMRMSYAWKQAARVTSVTTSTTAVAFLANCLSPLMPVKAFGIFAATILVVNLFLILTVFPPCLVIAEENFSKLRFCFCLFYLVHGCDSE